MESEVIICASLAIVLAVTALLSWRQGDERRDVMLVGGCAAGFSLGTIALWAI